jgi:hypothetical protein
MIVGRDMPSRRGTDRPHNAAMVHGGGSSEAAATHAAVRDHIDAFNAHDTDRLIAGLHPDVIWATGSDVFRGAAQVRDVLFDDWLWAMRPSLAARTLLIDGEAAAGMFHEVLTVDDEVRAFDIAVFFTVSGGVIRSVKVFREGSADIKPPFVPADFEPPIAFPAGDFRLEPLGPQHNERDYAAWMSSIEHIRRSPGFPDGNWPHEMSLEENRSDLVRHVKDFTDRKGFTYTVLDSSDDVVGCVYIYPAKDGVHDAEVQSWVRKSQAARDDAFRHALAEWLTSDAWPFDRPFYPPLLA